MKIKNELIEAFSNQKLIPTEYRRYRGSLNVCELEVSDFDKAIDLLKVFGKRAGIKEFELLKSEFTSGRHEDSIYEPDNFVELLKDVITKRMSGIERRIALDKVNATWDLEKFEMISENYYFIANQYAEFQKKVLQYEALVNYHEQMNKYEKQVLMDIETWLKTEVEENESSIQSLSDNDWEDIRHQVACGNETIEMISRDFHKQMRDW